MSSLAPSPTDGRIKQQIALRFGHAAPTYDRAATLQAQVANRMWGWLPAPPNITTVLDMGCGTGRQTARLGLHYNQACVIGMDLSYGMLTFAKKQNTPAANHWLSGDIDQLPCQNGCLDLVFSSLAIQWCDSLEHVLSEMARVLKPGGRAVFSTLAAGSLHELNAAWQAVDCARHVNRYADENDQYQMIKASGLKTVHFETVAERFYYPNILQLLRQIKAVGANTVTGRQAGPIMGRNILTQLGQAYQPFVTCAGLPITYRVIYAAVQKPL